jgi:hypothetical protein
VEGVPDDEVARPTGRIQPVEGAPEMINKKFAIGAIAGVGVAACIAACAQSGTCQKQESAVKPTVWDKIRKGIEEMPEDFPPRVMLDNVEAMKANTDEILQLLKQQSLAKQSLATTA